MIEVHKTYKRAREAREERESTVGQTYLGCAAVKQHFLNHKELIFINQLNPSTTRNQAKLLTWHCQVSIVKMSSNAFGSNCNRVKVFKRLRSCYTQFCFFFKAHKTWDKVLKQR